MRLQTDELIWNECLTTKRIGRKTISTILTILHEAMSQQINCSESS